MEEEYRCEYKFDGKRWVVSVHAHSPEEASRKLRAIGTTGVVLGTVVSKIPIPGGSWVERLIRWLR